MYWKQGTVRSRVCWLTNCLGYTVQRLQCNDCNAQDCNAQVFDHWIRCVPLEFSGYWSLGDDDPVHVEAVATEVSWKTKIRENCHSCVPSIRTPLPECDSRTIALDVSGLPQPMRFRCVSSQTSDPLRDLRFQFVYDSPRCLPGVFLDFSGNT